MSLPVPKCLLRRSILSLSFLLINKVKQEKSTVGGTSSAALRPGFFLGGRTQVLLNAPFEMTVGKIWSSRSSGDGGEALGVSGNVGLGARGVPSRGLNAVIFTFS